jgi:hypothetical protein
MTAVRKTIMTNQGSAEISFNGSSLEVPVIEGSEGREGN